MPMKMLFALGEPFGARNDIPKVKKGHYNFQERLKRDKQYYDEIDQYFKENPSLKCTMTQEVLNCASRVIIQGLSLELQEQEKRLATLFAGTIVLSLIIQDKYYGAQNRYGGVLLYPSNSFDDLFRDDEDIDIL
jgi:hypothetical protein